MGEAKRNKTKPVWIAQGTLYNAYYNWADYHGVSPTGSVMVIENFERFMGCEFNWYVAGFPASKRIAKKLQRLASVHYHALLHAHYIRRNIVYWVLG